MLIRDGALAAHRATDIRAAESLVLARLAEGELMDRAAAALAAVSAQVLQARTGGVYGRRAVMLVGPGNNGGDALLAGARLQRRGVLVLAVLTADTAHVRGVADFRAAGGRIIKATHRPGEEEGLEEMKRANIIIDGMVGIGGRPSLSGASGRLATAVPAGTSVVSADMPSGLDPDSGVLSGVHVRADVTVSFGALKPCLLLPPASDAAGQVVDISVGIEEGLPGVPFVRRLTGSGVAARWPIPAKFGHKYTRGVLGAVAGSDAYPGAAVLAVAGAQRAGVGIVRFIGPPGVTDHVLRAVPESVPGGGRVQAWLLGSGVESDSGQDRAIAEALNSGLPCVVDAGALAECVRQRAAGIRATPGTQVLLTPHAGEVARVFGLLGESIQRDMVESSPALYALRLAAQADATVLLKGSTTLIASPEGWLYSQSDGPAWLATAGSGDVLAGIAGALMAQGISAMDAGAMAAYVHGQAAIRASAGGPIAAGDVANALPTTIANMLGKSDATAASSGRK
ncbi:NAD(P)H-hydrate epimerase [Plantactinospora sp. WMMB334]|uniref:NAD(P)H-hydrate epimerase n=1 Tax=Plantactinospora sp. WMMB334 TaxID=3404119 RepID=UPI003B92A9D4